MKFPNPEFTKSSYYTGRAPACCAVLARGTREALVRALRQVGKNPSGTSSGALGRRDFVRP
eukprot:988517-Prymnesium_polylepis.1